MGRRGSPDDLDFDTATDLAHQPFKRVIRSNPPPRGPGETTIGGVTRPVCKTREPVGFNPRSAATEVDALLSASTSQTRVYPSVQDAMQIVAVAIF